jgi:hypothetical protein
MTAAVSSFSTQSLTQISFTLQTSSSASTGGAGLAFTANGATYNGQPISLSDISNDRSGRFSDAQKQQATQAQQQLSAQRTIAALNQFLPTEPGSSSQSAANGGAGALSSSALQLLNELNAQAGTGASVQPSVSMSISVTGDTTVATNVAAGSDASTR